MKTVASETRSTEALARLAKNLDELWGMANDGDEPMPDPLFQALTAADRALVVARRELGQGGGA